MLVYSLLLLAVLLGGAPWWLARIVGSGRYRAGLPGRLGRVPPGLREACAGKQVIWLHAVSVGEVLAATRLVEELRVALPGVVIAVSTTTETGQRLARERFAQSPVFYLPLDFAVLMRRYLRALQPRLVVLMESELWPNMIQECSRAGVPIAVANARVSDRSFPRYMRLRRVWRPLLRQVSLYLAQSEETAARLKAMGVKAERVVTSGNLKYDIQAPRASRVAELVRMTAAGRPVVVAGSTVADATGAKGTWEEELAIQAWANEPRKKFGALLVLAPRHPDRFPLAELRAREFVFARVSDWLAASSAELSAYKEISTTFPLYPPVKEGRIEIVLLDTIGDLAAVYGVGGVAFVGGSLVAKGGHNPLEPAQFGVPVVMGQSYENFREIVEALRASDAIRIVANKDELEAALVAILMNPARAKAMGERGRTVFEAQSGATARVVTALIGLMR